MELDTTKKEKANAAAEGTQAWGRGAPETGFNGALMLGITLATLLLLNEGAKGMWRMMIPGLIGFTAMTISIWMHGDFEDAKTATDFVDLAQGFQRFSEVLDFYPVDFDVMVLRFNVHQGIAYNTSHDPRAPPCSGYGAAYIDDQRVKIHDWLDPYFRRA